MDAGFVGLGQLGRELLGDLLAGGHLVTVFDVMPVAMDALADVGAKPASSPAEVARSADLVGICVVNDEQLREVVDGRQGLLRGPARAGSVILVHSTVRPATCRELAEQASQVGVALIDAPISYGTGDRVLGNRTVVVGGDDDTFERARPYLESVGHILRAGAVGTAVATKLINNLLLTATMGATTAALEVGRQWGIDEATLRELITDGSASGNGVRLMLRADGREHRHDLLSKDVGLALESLGNSTELAELGRIADMALNALLRPSGSGIVPPSPA